MAAKMFINIVYGDFHGARITPRTAWEVSKDIWLTKNKTMGISTQQPEDDNTELPVLTTKQKFEAIRSELVKIANCKTTPMETNHKVNGVLNMIDSYIIYECVTKAGDGDESISQYIIDAAVDKYSFRVPYDGTKKFYDEEAAKHYEAGIYWALNFINSTVK